MNKKLLEKAVKQEIISNEQAKSLLDFFAREEAKIIRAENTGEQLKFIRSFGDIFIALGVILLAFTSSQLAENTTHQLITIAVFFLIAEWLVGHKRLVLPGITLLLSILYFVNALVDRPSGVYESLDVFLMIITGLLFYIRYKMPFSLYPVAVGCIYLFIELSGINIIEHPYIFILLGMAVFIVAMWYDTRDTQRVSSLSDNAFWLHLLAAPLIVHGVMVSLFLSKHSGMQANSLSIFLLFILFFFIALFVDRRAILVSSFAYALYAVYKFSYQQFMQVDNLTLFIFMGVGIFIIFFGTYWYKVRTWVFSPISSLSICKLVPDFNTR
ncbi:MAG: hypothetical protein QNL62_05250 [Gammaproteobacteria bacterium]|nr:hypothetical protein [Gammaproteobacteria bacterium]